MPASMMPALRALLLCVAARSWTMPRVRPRPSVGLQSASPAAQWASFQEHQARGEWFCARTSYDAGGEIVDDDSLAIVTLRSSDDGASCAHSLKVPATAVESSGCDRCASTIEWRSIPLGTYSEAQMGRFVVDDVATAVGPQLLRSGGCSFEVGVAAATRRCAVTASRGTGVCQMDPHRPFKT